MSYSSIADYEERLKEVDERSESNEVVPYDIPQTIKKIERPQGMGDRGVDGNDRPIWARTKVSGDKPQTAVEKGTTLQYRIVRNGVEEAYEVPEHLQEKFERKYPDARIAYTAAGNNYLVPIWKREKFFKEYPDATAHLSPRLRHTGESAKGKALREQPGWPMASDTDMRRSLQESIAAVGKSLEERYDVLDKERADAEARQTGLGGFFYGAAQARRASLGMPDTFNPVYDKEYRQLTAANNLLGDTKELVEAVDNDGTFAGNALRGMRDGLFDPDTWTAGLLEMTDQVELLQAVEKAEKGERLTDAESALLDASALNYLINASYADQLSRGYKAGKVTAESLPFMLEMASNPASGIGRGLGGRIARAALKHGTSRFLGKAASWAGRAVGDVAGAAAMAATTGAARVGSDAVSRYIGSPDYDIDDDGNITFAGTHGGEDTWLSAFGKAFASTTIENHSEMAGEYFAPVGRLAKRATGWIPGFKQARRFIDETGKGRIGTALKEFKRMTRWDGTMGEFAEEIIGGMENALIVGDQTLDAAEGTGVFSKDNLIDTFLGVALMGGFFGGAQITGYRNPRKRIRDKLDAAGRNGEHVFGVEGWQPVSQLAEGFIASGTGMNTKRFRDFMSTMPKDQRMATIDYMGAIAEARGYANARAKTESEAASNPESEAAMSERLRKAYDAGSAYGGDISVLHTAWRNMGAVRSRLTEDELAMNDDDLAAYAMEPGNVARRKDITDYLESKNILQGGRDRFDDDAKTALEEKRKAFTELANKDTGLVTLVETKDGGRAYVTSGALSADTDGSIDGDNGVAITLIDEDGRNKRMVSASDISKILSTEDEAAYTAQEQAALANAGQVYESMVSAPTMEELEASVRLGEETFLRTPEGATVKVDDVTGIDSSGNVVYVENVADKKVPKMMPLADFVSMQESYVRSHAGEGRNAEENEPQRPADAQGVSGTSRQTEASSDIQVPRDKDGNVMYDELLASNPREYVRLYTEEFGEEAAREDMLSQLQSIDDEIEKRKNKISSSTSSDTKAKARREISALEGRRDALSAIVDGIKADVPNERAVAGSLSDEHAEALIAAMEEQAEAASSLELTPENWLAEFGEDGMVDTPLGKVKMGDNQYLKLAQQGRGGKLGMIRPTLNNPDVVIEDTSMANANQETERPSSYVFVKTFLKTDGSRYYHFTSVTVSREGNEVVVSNQEKSAKKISKLLQNGNVAWINNKFSLHPKTQIEAPMSLNNSNRPTSIGNQPAMLGINLSELSNQLSPDSEKNLIKTPVVEGADSVRASNRMSSESKDNTNPAQGQASKGKSSTAAPVFEDMPVNDAVAMIDESLGGDAAAFISDNIAQARKRLDKAERRRPKSTDFNQRIVENMEIESERREARRVLDAWNAMSERLSAVKAEMELERQRLDDISAGRDEVTESIRNDIEPQDMEELAAWVLSDRNIRITPESYYSETGYSPSDRRRLVGKFARKENGGMSVSEIGEMVESEALSRGWTGYDDTAGNDANAGRNAVLSVLNSVETVGDINNYISRKRKEHAEMLERENRNRLDALAYERGFANFDEMLEYDEWLQGEARRVLTSEDYNNYLNLLNEENSEGRHGTEGNGTQEGGVEGYNAGDGQGNIENEQGTVHGGRHEGSGLLQEERPGASVGTGESDGHASSVGNDTDETAHEDNGRQAAGSLRVNEGVALSPFAEEVAKEVLGSLPDGLKGRISVRSSSTGDESGEGFVQRYDIDGNPSKVYYVEPLDFPIDSSKGQYAIEGYNVDNPESLDEYSRLFREYMENKPSVEAYESDERGGVFRTFEDALDFLSFVDERKNDAGASSVSIADLREIAAAKSESDIQPIGHGAFGAIYDQFKGKAQEAIEFLSEKQDGEAIGALHHKDVGDIDLVWGNEKMGLRHIIDKHPGVLENLQGKLNDMSIVSSSDNRIVLESDTHKAVVSNNWYGERTDNWLLTAYEKKKGVSGGSIDIDPEPVGRQNGTAPLQNTFSASKGNENNRENQTGIFEAAEQAAQKVQEERDMAEGSPRGTSSDSRSIAEKIEDYGEQIAGARKDTLKDLAKSVENTTLKSLISLPFAKAFKRPNLKKAFDEGALREKDVRFAEAVIAATLSRKKPKAGTKEKRYRAWTGKKTQVEEWAETAYSGIEILRTLFNSNEHERDTLINDHTERKTFGEVQARAVQRQLEEWNPGRTYDGTSYPLNQIAVFSTVLERSEYEPGSSISMPVTGVVPDSVYGSYNLIDNNGKKYYLENPRTFEEVVDSIVYLTKLDNADGDTVHPREFFSFAGREPVYNVSGWTVYEFNNPRSVSYKDHKFQTKEDAQRFIEERNKNHSKGYLYLSGPREIREITKYNKYEAVFRSPLTGDKVDTGIVYDSREEAENSFDTDHGRLNDAVNQKLSDEKSRKKGESSEKDILEIIYYKGENGWKYGIAMADTARKNQGYYPVFFAEDLSTRKEAEELLNENREKWESQARDIKEKRQKFVYFDGENQSRAGEDYRNGENVTVEEFASTFGFRGVQFGNWTNQNDRQAALNNAFDAFMDLSMVLDVSPRALSLNGELGIAFGSRGTGSANAHYEPGEVVINLTKTRGAGSLAHEWWHALDNYFARQDEMPAGFATSSKDVKMRKELRDAFNKIIDNVEKSDFHKRSRAQGTYWGSRIEETARLFGEWVVDELAQRNSYNHFLSRGIEGAEERYASLNYSFYRMLTEGKGKEPLSLDEFRQTPQALSGFVYPTRKELAELGKDVRSLFDTVQEKTDEETGNVALYDVRNALEPERIDEDRMAAYDAVVSMLGKAGIPVETLSNEQMEQMRGGVGITSQAFDNMVHGLQALEEISEGKDEVRNAMRRDDISEYGGDNEITFVWGTPGEPEKNYKGGSGISHIAAKHGSSTLLKMLDVIANGQVSRHVEGNKTLILEKDGYEAVLALTRFGNRESWLLTGWEKNEKTTGGNGEVSTTSVPTQISPTFSRADLGAVVSDAKIRINPVNPRLMTVYHGSGADFDRFDHSFMGMGEGAQAYGWGSYVTEVKGIGRTYARENASGNLFVSGFGDFYLKKLREAISEGRNFTEEKNNLLKWHAELYKSTEKDPDSYSDFRHDYELLSSLQKSDVPQSHLYTVEIPDDTGENYLKWEEDVPGALDKERIGDFTLAAVLSKEEKDDTEREMLSNDIRDSIEDTRTGKDLYKAISLYLGDKEASSLLHDIGFTGISYPAQYTTGGRKDGARNYVIFDENDLKITDHIRFLQDGKGVVYGATVGGRIYINAERINPETPIHEYTHIWDDACRRNNPELWKRGVELMKGTSVWQDVVNDGNYSDLRTDDEIAGEVHARLTGKDGAALMERLAREARESGGIAEAAERISIVNRLKKWLSDFWYWLKDTMSPWTREEASRVGLENFVNMPLKDLAQGTRLNDEGRSIDEVNARFNEQLDMFTDENADNTVFDLGNPSGILLSAGVVDKPMKLYGSKVAKKMKKHGFKVKELKDLPYAVANPIAVFNNYKSDTNRAILTELKTSHGNFLVTLDLGKGEDVDFNIISSVFGKEGNSVINWINEGNAVYVNKEKALDYLHLAAPIAAASNNQGLVSATNIVENFENPKIPERKALDSIANRTENTDITDIEGKGLYHIDESPVKTGVSGQIEGKKSVAGLAEKLGVKVDFIESGIPERLSGKKGAYNARTGEITIIVPNHEDAADMEETLLHEAVGHNGLRSVFGDDFDSFLSEVYRNASPEQRRGMVMNAREYGITRPGALNVGVEEYLADMAETTDFDNAARKLWDFVVSGLRGLARRLGFDVHLGDAEIRYMLRTSYDNLVAGNAPIEREARRVALERRLGLNMGHVTDTRLSVPEETAHVSMDDISDLFDEELQMQIEGNLPKGHIYQLGRPGAILLSTGIPDLPIELSSIRLAEKAKQRNHEFDIGDVRGLVKAINQPVAVFSYGNKNKAQNVIVEIEKDGKKFIVGIHINQNRRGLDINDIRGIFPKNNAEWLNWITQGKLLYVDKKKIQTLIDKQRTNLAEVEYLDLDSIANIIENFESPKLPDENADLRFRSKEKAMKKNADDFSTWTSEQASYKDRVNSAAAKFSEQYMDYMKSVGILQEELAKKMGRELYEFEDVWTLENHKSSRNKAEMDFFRDRYFKPLCLAAAQFMDAAKISHEDLTKYQFAKHGLERNRVFAERDGITEKRDYSGLTALFGVEDVRDAERQAAEFVEEVERRAGKDMTDMLWEATNKATKQTLLKQYRSGMMSRSTYEKVRDMFRYYVPMRGFEEETAEDVFDYVFSSGHRYEKPVQKAFGRRSVADNPLAYIMQMAYGAIVQGNNNMVKQRLYNLALNADSPLLTVSNVWLVKNEGTDEWTEALPEIGRNDSPETIAAKLEEFENRMKSLEKEDKARRGRSGVDMPLRTVDRQADEHTVYVRMGDRRYAVFVNGDPRAAQAINGLLNPDREETMNFIRRANRWLAANFTTRSPKFIIRNMIRDSLYAATAVSIKEDGKYFKGFMKNLGKNYGRMWGLIKKYQDGTLDEKDDIERYMKEFIMNGGETGYTALMRLEDYKRMTDRLIGRANKGRLMKIADGEKGFLALIDYANRCAEDMARFAVYVTSRESGRSVERSISDAKNVSVNFNTKGAGRKYGANFFRTFYLFFNAGVQGLSNFVSLAKKNPKKFSVAMSVIFLSGVVVPMLNALISDAIGGDDDEYLDLPDWVRRNNIVIGGGGFYLTIPLGIEMRALYGMGGIIYDWSAGRMKHKNVGLEMLEQVASMLPLDISAGGDGWGGVVEALTPDLLAPIMQVVRNRDFTGKPIYRNYDYNKLYPGHTKAYAGTNKALVKSTELLNDITGGDLATRGAINLNPAVIEHLVQGYFGGALTFWNEVSKTVSMAWDEDARELNNVPILNVFLQHNGERTASSYDNDVFYHYKDEADETEIRLREYRRNGMVDEYVDLARSGEYMRYMLMKSYEKRLKSVRNAYKNDPERMNEESGRIRKEAAEMLLEYDN